MAECKQYLDVLIEGLKKKNKILAEIVVWNSKQAEAIKAENLDAFDEIIGKKETLIEELNRIDNGFQSVFDRIKDDVMAEKDRYREELTVLQNEIRRMTDLGVEIEAGEQRNKAAIEQYFSFTHKNVNQSRKNARAASDYYKNMSRVNYVDPQLMDKKK